MLNTKFSKQSFFFFIRDSHLAPKREIALPGIRFDNLNCLVPQAVLAMQG